MKNKYQIALDNIVLDINEGVIYSTDLERFMKDLKTLQKLVDKTVPAKTHIEDVVYSNGQIVSGTWYCPNCYMAFEIDYLKYDYCPGCGQKLDWSYEDE